MMIDPENSVLPFFLTPIIFRTGLVDSLLVCVCPATFDKVRLVRHLGQLEDELLEQAQDILRRYLSLG